MIELKYTITPVKTAVDAKRVMDRMEPHWDYVRTHSDISAVVSANRKPADSELEEITARRHEWGAR